MNKQEAFLENAKLLIDSLDIVPLLYGSLGLEYLMGENLDAEDIDILIPKVFVTERWPEFKELLERNGYRPVDEHEHTFKKQGVAYSYAQLEELSSFADISESEIAVCTVGDVRFRLLSLPQYLKVYLASSKDGYRIHVREKKDAEKIAFIKRMIGERAL